MARQLLASSLILLSGLAFFSAAAYGDISPNMCTLETCKAGAHAITYATKNEPYYSCPRRELTDYVSFILGVVAIDATMGIVPNISDQTGEPEVKGDTKAILDNLRSRAQVTSADDAVALCQSGKNGRKVLVINVPDDALLAVYVHDLKANTNFWMPIGSLNKLPN
jgi:hypothetical protein